MCAVYLCVREAIVVSVTRYSCATQIESEKTGMITSRTKFVFRAFALLAIATYGSRVQSADLVYTFEHGPSGTLWNVATAPDLPQFDSSLGTLNSISLLLDYSFSGDGTFTNNSGVANTYTIDIGGRIGLTRAFVSGTGFGSGANTPWVQSDSDYITVDSKTFPNLAPSTPTSFSYSYSSSSSATITGADMASFIGTGSLPTYLKANTVFTISGSGETTITTNPLASGKITLSYNFTPVPEPSTYAMAALSASTIVAVSVRRSRRKTA